ncbi:MAG: hypothetical protein GY754_00310 [bacterium]|nr:hypothetical protein [bacterium]
MSIVDICRQNALIYSEKICLPLPQYGNIFPEYFDWADHVASPDNSGYPFHLNKIVSDIELLAAIFEKSIPPKYLERWQTNWFQQTLAAAWIHDIGMIDDRDHHGRLSAEFLFKNSHGFDFSDIVDEDKIKIALLCIKHNRGWSDVRGIIKEVLSGFSISTDLLSAYFTDEEEPIWELDFSGKLISTADSLRHRGTDLKNNLTNPFSSWSFCEKCQKLHSGPRGFCSTSNCDSVPVNKAALLHPIPNNALDLDAQKDITLYTVSHTGECCEIKESLPKNAPNDVHTLVRDEYQVFTRGDMALFNVSVKEINSWKQSLENEKINLSILDEYIFNDNYKTVLEVSIDSSNPDAALFTLSKYITEHLDQNIATDDKYPHHFFSNNSIFCIRGSNEDSFSEFYNKTDFSACKDEVSNSINNIRNIFHQWGKSSNIILPVQIMDFKLEVVVL